MRKAITALVGSTVLLASSAALAQQYGGQAGGSYGTSGGTGYSGGYVPQRNDDVDNVGVDQQIVFGVDRAMGIFFDRITLEPEGSTTTNSTTSVALFGNASGDVGGLGPSMTTIPRLALDYFVTEGVSLGASFMYIVQSGEEETEPESGSSNTRDLPTQSVLVIHPRIGYSFIIDETFAIWPRAGITWGRAASESTLTNPTTGASVTSESSRTALDLSLDIPVVISPMEHFAILIGPYVDLGVSGTAETPSLTNPGETTDVDSKQTSFGLATGVAGYF
jgi:hypothetical protein